MPDLFGPAFGFNYASLLAPILERRYRVRGFMRSDQQSEWVKFDITLEPGQDLRLSFPEPPRPSIWEHLLGPDLELVGAYV